MIYDKLLKDAQQNNIEVHEVSMKQRIKGLYSDGVVWINRGILTRVEKACILAEEMGHHYTTAGNILDQSKLVNRKQERRARTWAYEKLVPLTSIIEAHKAGIRNRFEFAERLQVTEQFLSDALDWYQEKYGLCVEVGQYTVVFEPLGVAELFEF